jgi:ABC-type uncharacterized transport system involved in gliding motility auxiliary subunit
MADEIPSGSTPPTLRQRRLVISANVLLQIAALLALLGMVNWLVSRHYFRYDWTKSRYYKISEKTKQELASLQQPVKIIVFLEPDAEHEYIDKIFQDTRDLLKEFQYFGQGKLQIEYLDPERDRARAEQLIEQYNVSVPNVVIFACGPRHKYVTIEEMADFDMEEMGQSYRVKDYKGEGAFLAAIQTVTEEEPPKIYFLTGHGERDPESFDRDKGYSGVATYIKRDNLEVLKWNLPEEQKLPADAGAIIIAGPHIRFTQAELALLDDYLKNKGRLFVMVDPHTQTGLELWLQHWNVQLDDDVIVRKAGAMFGAELLDVNAQGVDYLQNDPITAKLGGVNTSFPYARSVHALLAQQGSSAADQPTVLELVKTSAEYWGNTDPQTQRTVFDPSRDVAGPLPLAVSVEAGKPQGVNVDIGVTRLMVVGTSSFVDNGDLAGGNRDFFMNALNWLLKREQLLAVGPKVPEEFRLDMSVEEMRAVYALVIVVMPLAVGLIGLFVWTRRRK